MTPLQGIALIFLAVAPVLLYAWVHDGGRASLWLFAIVVGAALWAFACVWLVVIAGRSSIGP